MKISKEFIWEMSHRISEHKGLCKNIHGHTYKMAVKLKGEPAEDGMLLDYYDMAIIVDPLVDELNHAFLVEKKDKVMLDFLIENEFKYKVIDKASTAENISEMMIERLMPEFKKFPNLSSMKIRIYETPDTYAETKTDF
ncbi:MAG: 6-pyruvoyl tetrahydropterin synthase [Bacteroidetes bacterium 4572_112]|nr:MAG: 6-pyruvoyl tetrahydropterin synthase [Bacteroidetes bacterium 4572_112]